MKMKETWRLIIHPFSKRRTYFNIFFIQNQIETIVFSLFWKNVLGQRKIGNAKRVFQKGQSKHGYRQIEQQKA